MIGELGYFSYNPVSRALSWSALFEFLANMKSEQLKYLSSVLAVILVARLGPLLPQVNGQDPSGVLALHGTGQPAAAAGETVYEIKVLPDSPDNTVDIWVSATTSDVPAGGEGPQGWEMGISHDPNLTFVNATVDGLVVVTLRKRDLDGDRVSGRLKVRPIAGYADAQASREVGGCIARAQSEQVKRP